jgi:hypothetical protein
VSRIAADGKSQWTYEFPLNTWYDSSHVFIEYSISAVSGGANTLVIAGDSNHYIAIMKISSTESEAATGPVV